MQALAGPDRGAEFYFSEKTGGAASPSLLSWETVHRLFYNLQRKLTESWPGRSPA
jgi:hypothetical protein